MGERGIHRTEGGEGWGAMQTSDSGFRKKGIRYAEPTNEENVLSNNDGKEDGTGERKCQDMPAYPRAYNASATVHDQTGNIYGTS